MKARFFMSLVVTGIFVLGCADSKTYTNQGVDHIRKGDWDQAILDCTKAIEIDSRDAIAYNNRGAAYGMKGDYGQAILDYKRACELGLEAGCKRL